MKVTVFQKTVKTREGRTFNKYVANLEKKDGTRQYVTVKFKDCDAPRGFPIIIDVPKDFANMSKRTVTRENGDSITNFTLWVNTYSESAEKYVDHSLDEYM